jgi:hypothetical protein
MEHEIEAGARNLRECTPNCAIVGCRYRYLPHQLILEGFDVVVRAPMHAESGTQ